MQLLYSCFFLHCWCSDFVVCCSWCDDDTSTLLPRFSSLLFISRVPCSQYSMQEMRSDVVGRCLDKLATTTRIMKFFHEIIEANRTCWPKLRRSTNRRLNSTWMCVHIEIGTSICTNILWATLDLVLHWRWAFFSSPYLFYGDFSHRHQSERSEQGEGKKWGSIRFQWKSPNPEPIVAECSSRWPWPYLRSSWLISFRLIFGIQWKFFQHFFPFFFFAFFVFLAPKKKLFYIIPHR